MIPISLANLVTGKAARIIIPVIVMTAAVMGSYIKGRSDGTAIAQNKVAIEHALLKERINVLQKNALREAFEITKHYLEKKTALEAQIEKLQSREPEVITKTVVQYVPAEVDTTVPKGFIALHNTAALGKELSEPANAAEATSVRLSKVGATVAENYYSCNAIRARLIALQNVVKTYQVKQEAIN